MLIEKVQPLKVKNDLHPIAFQTTKMSFSLSQPLYGTSVTAAEVAGDVPLTVCA